MSSNPDKTISCIDCPNCHKGLFSVFENEDLEKLNNEKIVQNYKKGQFIFKEKTVPRGVYCIHSGNVKITKVSEEGKEQIVRLAKPGHFIGYRALLCNDIYQASAIALEDTQVCFYNREFYLGLLRSNPAIAAQTIKVLTRDLKFAEHMMINMAQKHVKGRFAEVLLMLEEFYGVYEKDGTINAIFKREDFGHMVGTTTETSIRVISEFAKEKLIELKGKRIKLLDKARITKLSNRIN
ncbi:MAG: Crp/Fnr family transcriptional regulator [Sphingobacteriaceae bacterium]|nr:Crp/Fnr family transcriptional regulator [Sphingobacteriaceae bacterium]